MWMHRLKSYQHKNNKMKKTSQEGFSPLHTVAIASIIILIVLGIFYISKRPTESLNKNNEEKQSEEPSSNNNSGVENADGEMTIKDKETETMTKFDGKILAGKTSPLLDFTKSDYDTAFASDKLIVLYFFANWCPSCKAEFPLMENAFNNLNTDKVIGFRVNYNDNETDGNEKELARKFGVAYQHTKVFIRNGERILKSPESWSSPRYDSEINKALNQ